MTSYIQADESWIHEASQKALEQLRLRWKEKVDTWVAKINLERSKPRWFGLVKGLEPTLDIKMLKKYCLDMHMDNDYVRYVRLEDTFKKYESRLNTLINATRGFPVNNIALVSVEDLDLINKYTKE